MSEAAHRMAGPDGNPMHQQPAELGNNLGRKVF